MSDLKIVDREFLRAEVALLARLESIESSGKDLESILRILREQAIQDGEMGIVAALERKADQLSVWFTQMETLRESFQGSASNFIARIDELDDFVYGVH